MSKQTITIYDVAREAGVSMATVSRVVNGNPNVKPATRKKVLDIIDKLDYRPNAVARGLASKKTTTVGVIIPDITNVYFSSLARGIDDIATMYKYNIILASSDGNEQKESMVLNTLLTKQVDGIIFMGNELTSKMRENLVRAKTPVVLAGTIDDKSKFESVHIDYEKSVQDATLSLLENGNEKVAFVSGYLNESINELRLSGYKKALEDFGVEFNKDLVFETEYTYQAGKNIWQEIQNAKASAAFIGDDELAIGVMNGALDSGLEIPYDFEIITSNNSKLTQIVRPQLSSITQPLYDIGAVSMRLLTKLMNKEELEQKVVLLPFGYIKRNSTK